MTEEKRELPEMTKAAIERIKRYLAENKVGEALALAKLDGVGRYTEVVEPIINHCKTNVLPKFFIEAIELRGGPIIQAEIDDMVDRCIRNCKIDGGVKIANQGASKEAVSMLQNVCHRNGSARLLKELKGVNITPEQIRTL
ncbi:hypothetical protein KAR26_02850 [Candidatus Parcubacteria bacterium]|nr:hypothetical protein [Candidatus Parcubacteria bacterium]